MVLYSFGHTQMAFGSRMQTVGAGIVEITGIFVEHRHQAALSVEVDDRYAPNLATAADGGCVVLNIEAKKVGIHLVRLHVAGVEAGVSPVERGHQYYLLRRKCGLEILHQDVAAACEGRFVEIEVPVKFRRHSAVGVHGIHCLGEPLSHRNVVEEVIGGGDALRKVGLQNDGMLE